MKKIALIATSIIAIVCGGLYYHLNVQARFEQLQSQTITGQLESVKKEAREIEALQKELEAKGGQTKLDELYVKSNQLKSLLSTG
jgi:cell shape-determining protein MreC